MTEGKKAYYTQEWKMPKKKKNATAYDYLSTCT